MRITIDVPDLSPEELDVLRRIAKSVVAYPRDDDLDINVVDRLNREGLVGVSDGFEVAMMRPLGKELLKQMEERHEP